MPELKKKYLYYEDYKAQTVDDIFDRSQVRTAAKSVVYTTGSAIALNDGKGNFSLQPLPTAAQFTPVYAIQVADFNGDEKPDLLLGGNLHRVKPEIGIYDAGRGLLLLGDGQGQFSPLDSRRSGIQITGEIRDFLPIEIGGELYTLVARSDDHLLVLKNL
jgi:hypothetical protein